MELEEQGASGQLITLRIMLKLTEEEQERVDLIRHKLKFIEQKPTVACVEYLEPLVLAGGPVPEMISIAGGESISAETWESIRQQNPGIIIVMPKGYAIEHTIKHIGTLMQLPGFTDVQAIKNNRLYIANGERELQVVELVELLAEIINPKQFVFGYEGESWVKFDVG